MFLNLWKIFAQSDPFEIKPLGSTYPSTSSAAGASPSGTAGSTAPSGSPTDKPNNGAVSLNSLGFGLTAAAAGALAYLM